MAALRTGLPAVAKETAAAILVEVPGYSVLRESLGAPIDEAVEIALRAFLNVASGTRGSDPSAPLQPALDAAHALGGGEAREGRGVDALLAAYRVGARVAWREMARVAVEAGVPTTTLIQFAELSFAYIDELSAASVSGHAQELATGDRAHQRALERLTRRLLAGAPADVLQASAETAGWVPPQTLCAVLLPSARARGIRAVIDARSLLLTDELPGAEGDDETVLLLVPAGGATVRVGLKRSLADRQAVLGPERPWTQVGRSYERALRVRRLRPEATDGVLDSDELLAELVIGSDPEALADLRAQVLAPLSGLRPSAAAKLTQTLRAWLLHQGRREEVAAALFVHPQTVRYRMGQLREVYGDALEDPATVLAATVALGSD
ncbi:MAG: helix-turn-helix domain-containing protein [Solirubrobacterales bacterium]|nr:helix-turn-helix domain-containing protein [Solirubrobacterales bacterium]